MNSPIPISPLKRFFNLIRVDKQEVFSIYVYALFNGIISLSLPLGIQAIINLISGGQVSNSWIVLVTLVIVGVGFAGVMQIMQLVISENLQQKIFTRSAFEFAYRIPKMKVEALHEIYIPELVNRFFDTLSVQKGLSKILMDFSSASLQVLFGLILLSLYHPFFILFSFVLVFIVYLIFRITAPGGLKSSLVESKKKYAVAHWLEELARTMETFKMAGQSPLPLENTDKLVGEYLDARKTHFRTLLTQYINLVAFKVIVAAGLLVIGGLLVINQQMNIGQFVASEIIIILVLSSVEKLIVSMETIYDVLTATEKIGGVADIPLDNDREGHARINGEPGMSIQLNDLSYQFQGTNQPIIKNINLNIAAGAKICVSGHSGSGKSVLLQIIAGMYDQFSGILSYHGVPLGNWNKKELHLLIGEHLATEDIFQGTLMDNITLGKKDSTFEQIQELAEIVGLTDFIASLPEGYQTILAPEGKGLAKSIRLRVMLLRSLLGNTKVLLLEDSFNQLDDTCKAKFLQYILDKDWTVVATSNDPFVARMFDSVVVMLQGDLVANGPLSTLKDNDWYSNIFKSR